MADAQLPAIDWAKVEIDWAKVKRRQAGEAERVAETAAGIGEHGIANQCYRLQVPLLQQAAEIEASRG